MSCGCKKKNQPATTPVPNKTIEPSKLTQQDKLINEIVNKVRELSR
jgi:hypothetical protein